MSFPVPANETQRLAAVRSSGLLSGTPEPEFEGIALLASQLCGTPMALVSVVDSSRQWFKARVGIERTDTPRDIAFCAHTIVSDRPLVVEDARNDERFAHNPLVTGDPHVRFYAGIPLVLDDGSAIGSLCVLDREPRHLSDAQISALSALGRQVSTEISLRRKLSTRPPPPAPVTIETVDLDQTLPLGERPTIDQTRLRMPRTFRHDPRLPVPMGVILEQRYRLEEVLGEGGMGVVARALDLESGHSVALKFMHAQAALREDALQRFVREARVLFKLDSPHVAKVLDVGNLSSGEPFIVMEYLEGEDLETRIERTGALPVPEVVRLGRQLLSALVSAHDQGILHRDLKPANLFLSRDEHGNSTLKVLDFGISKLLGPDVSLATLTTASSVIGSPHYMAPEQMMSPQRADARSDLWSAGIVLYELATTINPFDGDTMYAICTRVLTTTPEPLSVLRPEVPASLDAIVARCLQKDADARFQSARELALALDDLSI